MIKTSFENIDYPKNEIQIPDTYNHSQPINVKVTDYSYGNINPSPIKIKKDTELLEEFLSPRKLQALTGVDNLETVEYLEMRVNTDQMSLGNFGVYLPNLTQMKLSGSYIPTIRDLGTSLWNLQVLWMPQCCLHCLDGLVTMSKIKELYLSYNEIQDISSCGLLEFLEILDLEGNHIADINNLQYLSMCQNLTRVTLEGNPICHPSKYEPPMTYRDFVFQSLPRIEFLDDIYIGHRNTGNLGSGDDGNSSFIVSPTDYSTDISRIATFEFEEHWTFINSMLVESGLLAESSRITKEMSLQLTFSDDSGRPSSSSCISFPRLNSPAMRPMSGQRRTLTTSLIGQRPDTTVGTQRPSTESSLDSNEDLDEKPDDSILTAGRVVCGNITKSLRRNPSSAMQSSISSRLQMNNLEVRPQTAFPSNNRNLSNMEISFTDDDSYETVIQELNQWRKSYEKSKERIKIHRAPQVLTIDSSEDDEIEEIKQNCTTTDHKNKVVSMDSESITYSNGKKIDHQIKLKPIILRNGNIKAKTKSIPINRNDNKEFDIVKAVDQTNSMIKSMKLENTEPNIMTSSTKVGITSPVTPSLSTKPPSQQISRIRRHLIQSGVNVNMTPSKPLLKR